VHADDHLFGQDQNVREFCSHPARNQVHTFSMRKDHLLRKITMNGETTFPSKFARHPFTVTGARVPVQSSKLFSLETTADAKESQCERGVEVSRCYAAISPLCSHRWRSI